jgi:hypothetical protein
MMTPVSVRLVTISSSGSVPGTIASEWYRVAMKGLGSPAYNALPSWSTSEVIPCMSSGACETEAPYASAIAWCPRHTPSSGMPAAAAARTTAIDAPARAGVPGPGEISTPR